MHELSIAQRIIEVAEQTLNDNNATKVINIRVRIGELSSVNKESLEFCYNVIAKDKEWFNGSSLIIEQVEWLVRCKRCGFEYNPNINLLECPMCGDKEFILLKGNELDLIDMEVE